MAPVAIQFFINGTRKVVSLNIYIQPKYWDEQKRRVTAGAESMKDYNLIIEQALAKANKIFVDYHLMEKELSTKQFLDEYSGQANRNDFINFMETELERRLKYDVISKGTYKGQKSTLTKLKKYKRTILFSELTPDFIEKFDGWHKRYLAGSCGKRGRNQVNDSFNTRQKAKSHIRTYINLAIQRNNVRIDNPFKVIKVKSIKGSRTFLEVDELLKLNELFDNGNITMTDKVTLAKFLFACFTSIRVSDSQRLHEMRYSDGCITFIPVKTQRLGKRVTIHLNETARKYYQWLKKCDFVNYSAEEMNRSLKRIAKSAIINKDITFHVARHTFATQFISNGGDVVVLQEILGHSDIRATMIYVHMARNAAKKQIMNMDKIFNI